MPGIEESIPNHNHEWPCSCFWRSEAILLVQKEMMQILMPSTLVRKEMDVVESWNQRNDRPLGRWRLTRNLRKEVDFSIVRGKPAARPFAVQVTSSDNSR